jgi:tryptophan synthase alpha chain
MKKQISIFTTAGYPEIDSLNKQLEMFEAFDIDFCEVGIPFSDPMADGPTIQETSMKAIANGMNIDLILQQLSTRKANTPIYLMGYLNPIVQYGMETFLKKCVDVNISGLILPDVSMEIYERNYKTAFEKFNIPLCFLVTPRTTNDRIQKAASLSKKGFLYLVSTNQITGGESNSDEALQDRYEEVMTLAGDTKVMIGFGIHDRASFDTKTRHVNGGIIGSAFLRALNDGKEQAFLTEITGNDEKIVNFVG